jgi:DNA processing protein
MKSAPLPVDDVIIFGMRSAEHLLALMSLRGIGPARALRLGAEPPPDVDDRQWEAAQLRASNTLERCRQLNVNVIGYDDDAFPDALRAIPAAPAVLYVRGEVDALRSERAVAVVGTREPSQFGETATEAFTETFADGGYAVVSGLALGVDSIAHQVALRVGVPTVAILGCGIDLVHPRSNTRLAEEIVAAGGALVSEQPLGAAVSPGALIARNRLQTGLSAVVCVMQSAVRGGTMHTARFALAQSRPVLCPGPIGQHPKNAGLRLLTAHDIGELPALCPAFASARALCREHAGRPLAREVTRGQLPDQLASESERSPAGRSPVE